MKNNKMIILLMLLYSALASSGLFSSSNSDDDGTKFLIRNITYIKHIPKQENYMTRHIDHCPDVGYFFKRVLDNPKTQSMLTCYLCFCNANNTAICWPRDNSRCNVDNYYHHETAKRLFSSNSSQARPRRSLSLSSLFMRDATRDILNKNTEENCKPHEESRSEGCPPVDWCVGCTVCDCDANGRWDCHLLSFCDDPKGKKKSNRAKAKMIQSFEKNEHKRTRAPRTQGELAQAEVQRLAQLINDIGPRNAKKYKGKLPNSASKKSNKDRRPIKSPIRPRKAHAVKNVKNISAVKNPNWIKRESVNGSKFQQRLIHKHTKVDKEEINQENVKKLANIFKKNKTQDQLLTTPKPLRPKIKYSKPRLVRRSMGNVKPANVAKTAVASKKPVAKKTANKNLANKKPVTKNSVTKKAVTKKPVTKKPITKKPVTKETVIKKAVTKKPVMKKPTTKKQVVKKEVTKRPITKKSVTKKPATIKPVSKKITTKKMEPKKKQRAKRTLSTTTTTAVPSKTKKKNKNKRNAIKPKAPELDRNKIIEYITQQQKEKFESEIRKLIEQTQGIKIDKRSTPLVKTVNTKQGLDIINKHTRSKDLHLTVKKSKINVDKSNKVKLRRHKRSISENDTFTEINLRSGNVSDIRPNTLHVLPKSEFEDANVVTTEPNNHYKYSVEDHITTTTKRYFTHLSFKTAASNRSIYNQLQDLTNMSVVNIIGGKQNQTTVAQGTDDYQNFTSVTEVMTLKIKDESVIVTRDDFQTTLLNTEVENKDVNIIPITPDTVFYSATEVSQSNLDKTINEPQVDKDVVHIEPLEKEFLVNISDITLELQTDKSLIFHQTYQPERVDDKLVLNISHSGKGHQVDEKLLNLQAQQQHLSVLGKQETNNNDFKINVTNIVNNEKKHNNESAEIFKLKIIPKKLHQNDSTAEVTGKTVSTEPQLPLINRTFTINLTGSTNDKATERGKSLNIIEKAVDVNNNVKNLTNEYEPKLYYKNVEQVIMEDKEHVTEVNEITDSHLVSSNRTTVKTGNHFTISVYEGPLPTHMSETIKNDLQNIGTNVTEDNIDIARFKKYQTTPESNNKPSIVSDRLVEHVSESVRKFTQEEKAYIMKINETKSQGYLTDPLIIVTTTYEDAKLSDGKNLVKTQIDTAKNMTSSVQQSLRKNDVDSKLYNSVPIVRKDNETKVTTSNYNDTLLVFTTENIKSKYNIENLDQVLPVNLTLSKNTNRKVNKTVIKEEVLPLSKVENNFKYQMNKSASNTKLSNPKLKLHKKGKKYKSNIQQNATAVKKDHRRKQGKLKNTIGGKTTKNMNDSSVTTTTLQNIVPNALYTTDSNADIWFEENLENDLNVTTESSKNYMSNLQTPPEIKFNFVTPANKVNSHDIKKVSVSPKRHRLKKIFTTVCQNSKDGRVYFNNERDPSKELKNNTKTKDLKNFFRKLLSSLGMKKSSKKDNKTNRFKMIKYLQKFFKRIFYSDKHKVNNTELPPQLNKQTIIETLCASFGPCNININNKGKLQSRLHHLNLETYEMLRSIKIIKGLLRLLNFTSDKLLLNETNNAYILFKSDIQKLHDILINTYMDAKYFSKLTTSEKEQIEYIKNTTQVFIQSAARFTITLNEIINIITADGRKDKKESNINSEKVQKRNIRPTNESQNGTIKPEVFQRLKDLISKYSAIQNSFMDKIYKVLSYMDPKESNKTARDVETNKNGAQNRTEEIQVYTRNIIQNLRKLKKLAQNSNGNVRRKRDLRDNDSIEYLLILMEYLLKQTHPLDAAPVNDGIDLLLEAIKHAPDIKPIQKKVLDQGVRDVNNTKSMQYWKEINISKEDSLSGDNIYNENNDLNHTLQDESQYNLINHFEDYDNDERMIVKKAERSKFPYSSKTTLIKVINQNNQVTSPSSVQIQTFPVFLGPNNRRPGFKTFAIADSTEKRVTPRVDSIENKLGNSNETDDIKSDLFDAELEEDIITTTVTETDNTSTPAPISDKNLRLFRNEDVSANRSRLDWLDETYVEEIKADLNKTSTIYPPEKKDLDSDKKHFKMDDISASDLSKEILDLNKRATDNVMHEKEMNLMNSLDYGTGKSEGDIFDSKESVFDDKYSGDRFAPYY